MHDLLHRLSSRLHAGYRRVLQPDRHLAEAYNRRGNLLREQGNLDEAEAWYCRALRARLDFAPAHNNLGVVWQDRGNLDEAATCYGRALQLDPGYFPAHNNLGVVWQSQGRLDEAAACYRRALQLKPDFGLGHNNLGTILNAQGRLDEATACYRRALQLDTRDALALSNLGNVLKDQGKLDQAVECCQEALGLNPGYAEAYNNLGIVFTDQGRLDEAVGCYRRALQLKPDFASAHSNLLLAIQYRAGVTLSELAVAHAEYDRMHAVHLRKIRAFHEIGRDPDRRLRVGFVSADFGRHPMGYYMIRVLENIDRGGCEVVCYSDRHIPDDLTRRFQSAADTWRDVCGLGDEAMTDLILGDRIDVLFDLTGHMGRNRLLVFARGPAPIQVTWAGWVGTTGLKAMDYILADRHEIPPGAECHYCENVLRMPDGFECYDFPAYAPPVGPLPAPGRGYVTFASFNNRAKITAPTVELWAAILRRVPYSRLVLKYKGMDDTSVARGLAEAFAGHAVDPARIECLGWSPHPELLSEYHRIDVALDPIPYNGCTTTCEAMWMGVPVVTCPGETFASRHSLSHLTSVGLTETIAGNLKEYVDVAVSLTDDLPRLAGLRAGLRERMAGSPLCDGDRFAANLMRLVRGAWREWCLKNP